MLLTKFNIALTIVRLLKKKGNSEIYRIIFV